MKTKHKLATLAATLITFGSLAGGANAAVILPAEFATVEGDDFEGTSLGRFSNTAQIVYDASLVSAAGINFGDALTGLSFRVNASDSSNSWSVADYQIRIATSLNSPGSLDVNFVNNRGADYTLVRSGPLAFNGTVYPTGGSPNSFGPMIMFDTSFTYLGGDLLLEYTHSAIPDTNVAADAHRDIPLAQSQFAPGFDGTIEGFDGFGDNYAPIVSFAVATIPEPSSALLLGFGVLGMLARRRKTS